MTGEEIRTLRKDVLGLTLQSFGAKLGFDASVVSRWENGLRTPDARILHILQCAECFDHYLRSPYATLEMHTHRTEGLEVTP